jgi:hypothetical protein
MSKVTVISEKGKLLGTWIPPQQPVDHSGPVTRIVARGAQELHEIEIAGAEEFHARGKTEELITLVKKQLRLE